MDIVFTTAEYPGALRNGTRVLKVGTAKHDAHSDGAPATVVGSVGAAGQVCGYFVHWDDRPGVPVFVAAHRVRQAGPP